MALLGAGYLIGIASGMAILVGTVLAWAIFVPYLTSVLSPAEGQAAAAFAKTVWAQKVRFIGAGTIGIAAIWTLIKLLGPVIDGIKMSISAIRENDSAEKKALHHTDIDMSPKSVGLVFLAILAGLFFTFYTFVAEAGLPGTVTLIYIVIGIVVAVLMGFFVAAACGYMAGLIGTSASPISGIGILGIIVSSLVVLGVGQSFGIFETAEGTKFATALAIFITSVIVSIASISNDNLQDLKNRFHRRGNAVETAGCSHSRLRYRRFRYCSRIESALSGIRVHGRYASCFHGSESGFGRSSGNLDDDNRSRYFQFPT